MSWVDADGDEVKWVIALAKHCDPFDVRLITSEEGSHIGRIRGASNLEVAWIFLSNDDHLRRLGFNMPELPSEMLVRYVRHYLTSKDLKNLLDRWWAAVRGKPLPPKTYQLTGAESPLCPTPVFPVEEPSVEAPSVVDSMVDDLPLTVARGTDMKPLDFDWQEPPTIHEDAWIANHPNLCIEVFCDQPRVGITPYCRKHAAQSRMTPRVALPDLEPYKVRLARAKRRAKKAGVPFDQHTVKAHGSVIFWNQYRRREERMRNLDLVFCDGVYSRGGTGVTGCRQIRSKNLEQLEEWVPNFWAKVI